MDIEFLRERASFLRVSALEDAVRAGKGHLGGTFSCVELLTSLYYGGLLDISPARVKDPDRDYLFIGKGHACLAVYPILYDQGYITREQYFEYGRNGGFLGGQLDVSIPGVECNTGSLGHAVGLAAGVALASKMDGRKNKAVALVGDAECEEGSIWEAFFFAAEHNLDNLICIIDRNRLSVTRVMESGVLFDGFAKKMDLFHWNCLTIDGHNLFEIMAAFNNAASSDRPTVILAHTIKGKGVSFMENVTKWHHSVPSEKEVVLARKELHQQGHIHE